MKITRNQLKELIRKSIREMDFKNQAAFDAYNKKHKMRKSTKVSIAGKDTTAGAADKGVKKGKGDESWICLKRSAPDAALTLATKTYAGQPVFFKCSGRRPCFKAFKFDLCSRFFCKRHKNNCSLEYMQNLMRSRDTGQSSRNGIHRC